MVEILRRKSSVQPVWALITLLLLLLLWATPALAQSTDRDNPTALSSNIIKGTGMGKKVEYFYSFNAGPGDLTLTVDLKATAGATSAEVELFDSDSKIFYYYPNATTQNEHVVKHVSVNGKQALTLRVALDSSAGAYTIKLGGAVEFTQPEMSQPTGAATPAADTQASQPEQQNTPQPESGGGASGETSGGKPGKGGNLQMGINILQAVGNRFALPTTGMLHVVMKDGTTQDIDLGKVKSASISKQ
jgi:hypothetical protein